MAGEYQCPFCSSQRSKSKYLDDRPNQNYRKTIQEYECGTKLVIEHIGPHFYSEWFKKCKKMSSNKDKNDKNDKNDKIKKKSEPGNPSFAPKR